MMAGRPGTVQPQGGIKEQLANIRKLIMEAQTLDDNGDELGAYRHYLASVSFTAQTLSADIHANQGQGTLPQHQAEQLFKMAKHCLERGESIFLTAKKEQRPLALFRLATPSPTPSPTQVQAPPISAGLSSRDSSSASQVRQMRSGTMPGRLMGIPPNRAMTWPEKLAIGPVGRKFRSLRTNNKGRGRGNGSSSSDQIDGSEPTNQLQPGRPVHHFSYMEEAKLRNRYMMEQYKAHLRQSSSQMLPASYQDAGLSMLRRLEENVSVAKIREQTIARKMKEREMRLRQEEANKPKCNVVFSTLTVDELCDHVTTFEHGKPAITNLKTRLNSSSSDDSVVYNTVNEILGFTDHPLNRLLGECQYNVYMMLQPVGSAIEKAGGLPRLEIRLDNCGMDRKPSEESPIYDVPRPHPPEAGHTHTSTSTSTSTGTGAVIVHGNSADDDEEARLLELLGNEDDDEDDELLAALSSSPGNGTGHTHSTTRSTDDEPHYENNSFDEKLRQLKASLTEDTDKSNDNASNGIKNGNGSMENGNRESPEYQNVRQKTARTSVDPSTAQQSNCYQNLSDFDIETNESYSLLTHNETLEPTDTSDTAEGREEDPLYENSDDIDNYLLEQQQHADKLSYTYEELDQVFESRGGGMAARKGKDSTDGGGWSRPRPPQLAPLEHLEMEELVIFKNLPTLICRSNLGDESSMIKLADTANSVLHEVVKMIHSTMDKLEECLSHCYPVLNNEENCEICHSVIEASLFPPIQSLLVLVYRCKNYREEVATAKNMCQHVNATPKDVSVRRKFWLLSQAHAPYGEAIDELRRVVTFQCPSPKVECLVHMSKRIIQCIDNYYEATPTTPTGKVDTATIGVDDILPILSYIIIRTGLPQLVSECALMEEFIQDGYMKGEEGFCLTSFLTALKYVSQMSS